MSKTAVLDFRPLADVLENASPAHLSHATKNYGDIVALDDVSLTLARGRLVAFLGPNGAGKTTAVQLLLGLAAPTSGVARVFGRDPRDSGNRVRTGAMLQVARVPETLKVREHIALFSSYYPSPMQFDEVVRAARLEGLEDRRFGALSGGQKQRVLFALAICGNPDLLVLDEPTVGLDVESRRTMWTQIREFVERGCAVLLTTHYLEEADALADQVIVIDRGRVIATGSPEEIKSRAAGKRIRCVTSVPVVRIQQIEGVTSARRDGAVTEISASSSDALVRTLLALDPALSELEVHAAGLEEAFLAMTGKG